jgi:hypothetical protein
MDQTVGVILVVLGGLSSASFYVPSYKIKQWAWETYWITLGFVAWVVMPPVVAWMATPDLVGIRRASDTGSLVLQQHFDIGGFRVLSHTGGMVDRTGQFGVS